MFSMFSMAHPFNCSRKNMPEKPPFANRNNHNKVSDPFTDTLMCCSSTPETHRGSTSCSFPRIQSACEAIHPVRLPDECICREPDAFGLVIECRKPFNSKSISLKISLDLCNPDGSNLSLHVTERDHGIDPTVAGIKAREGKHIPTPGLNIVVRATGHFGV
jgi:hypothetical protein